ncbi:MAG TPA: class I SAM-dependent methyltransferase [Lachnospiraceae bacterium]|nr:class I SAM-dependent methyltransferase [Lachnospiraceae bacterium]
MDKYDECKKQWNDIFGNADVKVPNSSDIGIKEMNDGLDWLCEGTETILDFGCGNGSMLFYCALRGTKKHIGIDMSKEGILLAIKRKQLMTYGSYTFTEGSIDELKSIESDSIDAILLSNIVDNLYPEDAEELMNECNRILKSDGKAFIKLNPYITAEQVKEWGIKVISEDLLNDGLILWNRTKEEWITFLSKYLELVEYKDVYFKEHDQYNRLLLMKK